jgi:hypothetical protein
MGDFNVTRMLTAMCRAAERRDGKAFASYFAEDGVYHDDFYGDFAGRERIAELINNFFHRDGRSYRWDMIDPVVQGERLYVRYIFSWNSILPEADGARSMFEGVSIMTLRGQEIVEYREVASTGTAFTDMNFHPERVFKILARKSAKLRARPEAQPHLTTP